jgi:hypothetical protein
MISSECTASHIPLYSRRGRRDVKVKDVHRYAHRRARIRNLENFNQPGEAETKKERGLTSTIPATCPCTGAQPRRR